MRNSDFCAVNEARFEAIHGITAQWHNGTFVSLLSIEYTIGSKECNNENS